MIVTIPINGEDVEIEYSSDVLIPEYKRFFEIEDWNPHVDISEDELRDLLELEFEALAEGSF